MSGVIAFALVAQSMLAADSSYHTALRQAQEQQKPLFVLIGATWCPGCQTMKQRVIPSLVQSGALKGVSFAHVDADSEAAIAQQLMRGGLIPQLIAFSRKADGQWHREQITGETSAANVRSLIERAVKAQEQPAAVATTSAIGN
jgi:thioredoxin-like negative regulator of GroEL